MSSKSKEREKEKYPFRYSKQSDSSINFRSLVSKGEIIVDSFQKVKCDRAAIFATTELTITRDMLFRHSGIRSVCTNRIVRVSRTFFHQAFVRYNRRNEKLYRPGPCYLPSPPF